MQTLAHLSDLHIGRSPERLRVAMVIRDRLRELKVDHIVVTGDCTEHGQFSEYALFKETFAEFLAAGTMTVLPGNHDRAGDEIAKEMMGNERIRIERRDGLHLVQVDSTGPHNRYRLMSHGKIDTQIIQDIETAVDLAAPTDVVVVALHHHLMPQPEELWLEKVATFFNTKLARELYLGQDLIQRLVGRCDLILHGHRHVPIETRFGDPSRPLAIFNAGSSTELDRFRVFTFEKAKLTKSPEWH